MFDSMIRFGYSNDLHDHLKGLDVECNDFTATSIYQIVFWIIIGSGLLIMINFYRGLFHRPKFTSKIVWLLHLLVVATIAFVYSYFRSMADLNSGNFCQDLHFSGSDCLLFALTAACYAFLFCLIISLVLKFLSIHHRKIPF